MKYLKEYRIFESDDMGFQYTYPEIDYMKDMLSDLSDDSYNIQVNKSNHHNYENCIEVTISKDGGDFYFWTSRDMDELTLFRIVDIKEYLVRLYNYMTAFEGWSNFNFEIVTHKKLDKYKSREANSCYITPIEIRDGELYVKDCKNKWTTSIEILCVYIGFGKDNDMEGKLDENVLSLDKNYKDPRNPIITEDIIKDLLVDVIDDGFNVEVLTDQSATSPGNVYNGESFGVQICPNMYYNRIQNYYKTEDIKDYVFKLDDIKSSINQLISYISGDFKISSSSIKAFVYSSSFNYKIDLSNPNADIYEIIPKDPYYPKKVKTYKSSDASILVINIEFKPI